MLHKLKLFEYYAEDLSDCEERISVNLKLLNWLNQHCTGSWRVEYYYEFKDENDLLEIGEILPHTIIFHRKADAALYKLTWL